MRDHPFGEAPASFLKKKALCHHDARAFFYVNSHTGFNPENQKQTIDFQKNVFSFPRTGAHPYTQVKTGGIVGWVERKRNPPFRFILVGFASLYPPYE